MLVCGVSLCKLVCVFYCRFFVRQAFSQLMYTYIPGSSYCAAWVRPFSEEGANLVSQMEFPRLKSLPVPAVRTRQ